MDSGKIYNPSTVTIGQPEGTGATPTIKSTEDAFLRKQAFEAARQLYPLQPEIDINQLISVADTILKYWNDGTKPSAA